MSQSTELPPVSNSTYVTPIFQFKAPYDLSELTDAIRNKMVLAVTTILSVEALSVVLSISSVNSGRRLLLQLTSGVIVSVGLKNFRGSARDFALQITQDNINLHMVNMGLRPVQLISAPSTSIIPGVK
jgi:hypothetical protein